MYKSTSCLQSENFFFLHPPATPIVIDDSSWKNAAESFTVALALTIGGYKSAIVLMKKYEKTQKI